MSTYLPLILDSQRGVPRRLASGQGLAIPGALAVAGGPGFFGAQPLAVQSQVSGNWGQSLDGLITVLTQSGLLSDGRIPGWNESLQTSVALGLIGPYKAGRLIVGSGAGWKALDQPASIANALQAVVARSGAQEEETPGVQAYGLGYVTVVACGATAPVDFRVGTLWFAEDAAQGAQVRDVAGWRRFEDFIRQASVTTAGLVQLADATAITAGTAGRVVDAAQLKAATPAASTAAAGLVQLADATAITAGTAGRVVDAAQLKAATPAASTAIAGLVQLADATAITAGTAGRVVDAAQLKAATPAASTATAGLVQLADATAITAGTAGRVVDAAQLKAATPAASTAIAGLVRLADAAAITAGTAGRVVDAAQLLAIYASPTFTGRTTVSSSTATVATLTDAATITPNLDESANFSVTLGGNRTIANPSNASNAIGQSGSLFIAQDATGGRTASWGGNWDWPAGVAPTLSTAANAVDRVDYIVRSATSIQAVFTANYS